MVVHRGEDLPVTALTNNTYEYSLSFFDTAGPYDSSAVFQEGNYSLKRFCWAARGAARYQEETREGAVAYAFGLLDQVAVERTMWRIVYDAGRGRVHFQTKSDPTVRTVDLGWFDLSCEQPVQILDMSQAGSGDLSAAFVDYTYEANFEMVKKSFKGTSFLSHLSDEVLDYIARVPESMECVSKSVEE